MEKREEEEKKQVLEPINSGSHGDTLIFSIWDFGGFGGFYLMIFSLCVCQTETRLK